MRMRKGEMGFVLTKWAVLLCMGCFSQSIGSFGALAHERTLGTTRAVASVTSGDAADTRRTNHAQVSGLNPATLGLHVRSYTGRQGYASELEAIDACTNSQGCNPTGRCKHDKCDAPRTCETGTGVCEFCWKCDINVS